MSFHVQSPDLRRRAAAIVLCAVVATASCARLEAPAPREGSGSNGAREEPAPAPAPPDAAEQAQAVAILRGAGRVEPVRIEPVLEGESFAKLGKPEFAGEFVDGFHVLSRGGELGEPFADRLESFLLNERNFAQPAGGEAERCVFAPRVALRAFDGTEWVAVVIDFDCNLVSATSSQGDLELPSISFAPGRKELVALVKEAFPGDPEVQALE